MSIKRMTEKELLDGLDAKSAHADEVAEPLPQEMTPLERLSDDFMEESQILGKALCNAAESLGFSKTEAAGIIGRERTNIVRDGIDPNSKSGELALMFIRVYRGLFAVVGGDQEDMRHWVTTDNQYFGRSPKQMMTTHHQGLAQVLMYLDAIRGEGLAEPLPQELTPLERLKGSVKRYERPTDPIWDDYFDSDEGVSDDFMAERHQPPKGR